MPFNLIKNCEARRCLDDYSKFIGFLKARAKRVYLFDLIN
jgi:hypothetical protein